MRSADGPGSERSGIMDREHWTIIQATPAAEPRGGDDGQAEGPPGGVQDAGGPQVRSHGQRLGRELWRPLDADPCPEERAVRRGRGGHLGGPARRVWREAEEEKR